MKRYYDTTRWRKLRNWHLANHPLCVMCAQQGRDEAATTVDHIIKHEGNYDLFWDAANLQSLCTSCHNSSKQQQELHGYSQAAGIDGQPIDKEHPWNKR